MFKKKWITLFIICFLGVSVGHSYASEQKTFRNRAVAKRVSEKAYKKAVKRLHEVYVGMSFEDFAATMGFKVLNWEGQAFEIVADGILMPLNKKIIEDGYWVNEYTIGYVKNNVVVYKKQILVKDDEVYKIINLENGWAGKVDSNSINVKEISKYWNKESYNIVKDKLKKIEIGMRDLDALCALGGYHAVIDYQFRFTGQGYLSSLYENEKTDNKVVQKFYYGYTDGQEIVPGFVLISINSRISDIRILEE